MGNEHLLIFLLLTHKNQIKSELWSTKHPTLTLAHSIKTLEINIFSTTKLRKRRVESETKTLEPKNKKTIQKNQIKTKSTNKNPNNNDKKPQHRKRQRVCETVEGKRWEKGMRETQSWYIHPMAQESWESWRRQMDRPIDESEEGEKREKQRALQQGTRKKRKRKPGWMGRRLGEFSVEEGSLGILI